MVGTHKEDYRWGHAKIRRRSEKCCFLKFARYGRLGKARNYVIRRGDSMANQKPTGKIKDDFIDESGGNLTAFWGRWRFEADSRVLREWAMDRIQTE